MCSNAITVPSRIEVAKARILSLLVIFLATTSTVSPAAENFLIPGADFSRLSLEVGAWCRYRVVDEALGQVDTTEIYIGVPSSEMTPDGRAFWVEIQTRAIGNPSEDKELVKLLVLDRITGFSEGDSLGDYVLKVYNQSGTHPPQETEPRRFRGFSLVTPTMDSAWESTTGAQVGTPAGRFSCTQKKRHVNNDREVVSGTVTLIKKARDDFTVWFCEDVPVFHLVKCHIARVRHTETVPPIAGIPASGNKDSSTTAELVAFGLDATPILSVESLGR